MEGVGSIGQGIKEVGPEEGREKVWEVYSRTGDRRSGRVGM